MFHIAGSIQSKNGITRSQDNVTDGGIQTQILINKLENVQVEAARIVTGGTRLVSLSHLYIETGWEKLKDRREKAQNDSIL